MLDWHRTLSLLAALALAAPPLAFAGAQTAAAAKAAPIPVILDTDIGDDIDDTWALVLLLKSPELDLRLVTTDFGDTVYRAKIVARILEAAARTDVPIGIGIREGDQEGGQAEWVRGYDLAKYPGRVHEDGVQALIDTVMGSKEPLTLIAIGPCPNLEAALRREPRIATRLRLAGMYGSIHRGYAGKPEPEPEWNVKADPGAARAVFAAPWIQATVTPLDTCSLVQLQGPLYARVRDSKDPLVRVLLENYRLWCPHQDWCAKETGAVSLRSSILYDTVAVYLAMRQDLVVLEELGVRVTEEGMTVPDAKARKLRWATQWKSLEGFESFLVARLTGPAPPR